MVNQTIDGEDYVIGSEPSNTVEQFYTSDNKEIKFLPSEIGATFPNLKEFRVWGCGLTAVRDFYLKNMGNVKFLDLGNNKITTIEPDAFRDLARVEHLFLNNNMIETLDEQLFATMFKLQLLFLGENKIRFMSPTTFRIPAGKLRWVDLRGNVCIDDDYNLRRVDQLEAQITANCTR